MNWQDFDKAGRALLTSKIYLDSRSELKPHDAVAYIYRYDSAGDA